MSEARIAMLDPAEIAIGKGRVTPLNERAVEMLRLSVKETGEIRDPIHVRRTKEGYELIDGQHRLEVAKRLGMERIAARVWRCSQREARLIEADANVAFTHMEPLDMAVSLAERKRAYLRLHPETAHGVAGAASRWGGASGMQTTSMSFAQIMAEIIGVSRRQIERIVKAGEILQPDEIARLRRAPRRIALSDIQEIGKISSAPERYAVVSALAEGRERSAAAARRAHANGAREKAPRDPVEEAFKALCEAWGRANHAIRRRFVEEHYYMLQPLVSEVWHARQTMDPAEAARAELERRRRAGGGRSE